MYAAHHARMPSQEQPFAALDDLSSVTGGVGVAGAYLIGGAIATGMAVAGTLAALDVAYIGGTAIHAAYHKLTGKAAQ